VSCHLKGHHGSRTRFFIVLHFTPSDRWCGSIQGSQGTLSPRLNASPNIFLHIPVEYPLTDISHTTSSMVPIVIGKYCPVQVDGHGAAPDPVQRGLRVVGSASFDAPHAYAPPVANPIPAETPISITSMPVRLPVMFSETCVTRLPAALPAALPIAPAAIEPTPSPAGPMVVTRAPATAPPTMFPKYVSALEPVS